MPEPVIESLAADLEAETGPLIEILSGLEPAAWTTPTPAPGWSIQDQVAHLLVVEQRATLSLTAPQAFATEREADRADRTRLATAVTDHRVDAPAALLAELLAARADLLAAFRAAPKGTRLAWYGPEMSLASMLTARLMETWAHGQDIRDALGLPPSVSDRLRHIARIGVATRGFSYTVHDRTPPTEPIAVLLTGPEGSVWEFGEPTAADRVEGAALDFCLVVTRRRHPADTALVATPGAAAEWLSIAQAFAGAPGAGREPGQFAPVGGGRA
jgi:uncharacterized protein (TIGR03084 family)